MTILAPTSSSSRMNSKGGDDAMQREAQDDPLRAKRIALQQQQARLAEIKRVLAQLHRVATEDRTEPTDGAWNIASSSSSSSSSDTGADKLNVASEIRQGQLLVPLHGVAFVKGRVEGDTSTSTRRKTVFVDAGSEFLSPSSTTSKRADGKVEVPVVEIIEKLRAQESALERTLIAQRDEVMKMASKYFQQHINETLGTDEVQIDEKGQAINEEGLPFVDLTEPLPQEQARPGHGVTVPFRPEKKSSGERKVWIDSILADLEKEEQDELRHPTEREASTNSQPTTLDVSGSNHKRVASADRPAPVKSVLKTSSRPTSGASTSQQFGASGFRKGFLNMNPSSPGAEHSSDPIDKIRWGVDEPMSASTSSLGSMAENLRSSDVGAGNGSEAEERTSRSMEAQAAKKKKTVRIQSPAGQKRRPVVPNTNTLPRPLRDENVEEEARQIVELLGIDAIKGHPQYESIKAGMVEGQNEPVVSPQASTKRKAPEGPAIRKDVIERVAQPSTTASTSARISGGKTPSAFKRGFLAKPPPKRLAASSVPDAPRQSHGVSALDRAARSDEAMSEDRVKRGLTAAVPHARPSQAYAEKLNARRQGRSTSEGAAEEDDDEVPAKMSKVRFGENGEGELDVRVGTAATERSADEPMSVEMDDASSGDDDDDDDDDMDAMGLTIHDEELDDEQVEALGFFSDDEMDPDVGFDSDDLVDAVPPRFDSDAGDIDNEELRREYERIKQSLQRSNGLSPHRTKFEDDDDLTNLAEAGQELSLAEYEGDEEANMSRFRRERLHRALMNKPATSRELGAMRDVDSSMQNAGPSMLIPSVANVRFPKALPDGSDPTSAAEIELDGRSDEEEDGLEDVMRARLARQADDVEVSRKQSIEQPPTIATASTNPSTAKKPSLFKSRMQNRE